MSMSQYASKADYMAAVQRNLHPHKAAVVAMWLWGDEYSKSGRGSMDFWDSLNDSRKDLCRRAVADVAAAPEEAR